MTERFENDWTREVEKLRADKAALLEACKLSLEKLSYYTDEYKGGPHIGVVRKYLKNVIAQAKKEG